MDILQQKGVETVENVSENGDKVLASLGMLGMLLGEA